MRKKVGSNWFCDDYSGLNQKRLHTLERTPDFMNIAHMVSSQCERGHTTNCKCEETLVKMPFLVNLVKAPL